MSSTLFLIKHNIWNEYCEPRIRSARHGRLNLRYLSIYKRYIKWFEDTINNNLDGIGLLIEQTLPLINNDNVFPLYITQNNIELYFRHSVVNYGGIKATIRTIFDALRTVAWKIENPGIEKLKLSPSIESSIEEQQSSIENRRRFHDSDPHNNLKDVMSPEAIDKLITYIYLHRSDSLDLAFLFLWGINGGVRGSSSRSFVLSDLFTSTGFGPERDPPRNMTLFAVLRKGNVTKDKHITDRQVGVQRHLDYRLCTIFATGMLVIHILRTNPHVSFTKVAKKRASWWDIPLNRYTTYEQEAAAMKEVYQHTGVESAKVTHFRFQAVQYAGSQGVTMEQVQTMTKHSTFKLHQAYQPEADLTCMKVMSGFGKVSLYIYNFFFHC